MIVGNGLIASAIESKKLDCKNIVFFASGVSNSAEIKEEEFLRERELLNKVINKYVTKTVVYFSSCSIDDLSSKYFIHKLNMEAIIQKNVNGTLSFGSLRLLVILVTPPMMKNSYGEYLLKIIDLPHEGNN